MKKRIGVITGSRADFGMLQWPITKLSQDETFKVETWALWGTTHDQAYKKTCGFLNDFRPQTVLLLGDRFEVMAAATACHLQRIPIAHIAGGDTTEGSYDDAMRDCISRMASIHFATSTSAMARLSAMGCRNIHLTGSPGIDFIRNTKWQDKRPHEEPYVVVSYQAETIDGTNEIEQLIESLPNCKRIYILPNPDRGSEDIEHSIKMNLREQDEAHTWIDHGKFLNLLSHCECFIGNSSAMLYEAPELGIKTRMVGKRQKGRTIPWGDGLASERMVKILRYA